MEIPDYILFALLGLPTWVLVDGTWAVLSQLAQTLPEGYNISSYLILCLTLGNLVPLVVGYNMNQSSPAVLIMAIRIILSVGFITGLLMASTWYISVDSMSLPLFVLFFTVGACSSTSNVTHYVFVSQSKAYNTTALATGMGIGSMVAGILALLQGALLIYYGFSVTIYYVVLALTYIPAHLALFKLQSDSKEPARDDLMRKDYQLDHAYSINDGGEAGAVSFEESKRSISPMHDKTLDIDRRSSGEIVNESSSNSNAVTAFLTQCYPVLLLLLVNASLGYGLVPAMISFACGKFNNAPLVLLLATGIAAVVDPMFKALTNYVRIKTFHGLLRATALLVTMAVGLLLCAALPNSSALYQGAGGILPIMLYVTFGSTFGFANTCVFRYFKDNVPPEYVQHAYRWSGICTQGGALLGSFISFAVLISGVLY